MGTDDNHCRTLTGRPYGSACISFVYQLRVVIIFTYLYRRWRIITVRIIALYIEGIFTFELNTIVRFACTVFDHLTSDMRHAAVHYTNRQLITF